MTEGKLDVVKNKMERMDIDILGISELRWKGFGHFTSDNHVVYYAGNESRRKNGVAFIVTKRLAKSVMKYHIVSDRIISIRLLGKPVNITVIQIYAPTTDAEEEDVDIFYDQLQAEIDKTCNQDLLLITGDWNAKVGNQEDEYVVGKFGLGERNEAGERLIEFCKTNNLFISNTFSNNISDVSVLGYLLMVNTRI